MFILYESLNISVAWRPTENLRTWESNLIGSKEPIWETHWQIIQLPTPVQVNVEDLERDLERENPRKLLFTNCSDLLWICNILHLAMTISENWHYDIIAMNKIQISILFCSNRTAEVQCVNYCTLGYLNFLDYQTI